MVLTCLSATLCQYTNNYFCAVKQMNSALFYRVSLILGFSIKL